MPGCENMLQEKNVEKSIANERQRQDEKKNAIFIIIFTDWKRHSKKKEKDKIIRNLKETQIESSHIQKSIQIN